MEKLKKILASTKTTIILFIIILVLFLICKETVVYRFETLASYLYGTDADNKGKLLSTILTAIGGVCVIWGLWLNNKKVNQQIRQVNEQVRQNDIAVQNSNDKRFGEAIGYLNNDNEGIVIGGIYALYQLAKEDERYAPIITNIFCNYVNDNTDKQDKKSYQTILSLLFSKDNPFVFGKQDKFCNIDFTYITLFCCADDVQFYKCKFKEVNLIGKKGVTVSYCGVPKHTIILGFKISNSSFNIALSFSIASFISFPEIDDVPISFLLSTSAKGIELKHSLTISSFLFTCSPKLILLSGFQ